MMTNNFAIIATLQNDLDKSKENEERLLMEIKKLKEVVDRDPTFPNSQIRRFLFAAILNNRRHVCQL